MPKNLVARGGADHKMYDARRGRPGGNAAKGQVSQSVHFFPFFRVL